MKTLWTLALLMVLSIATAWAQPAVNFASSSAYVGCPSLGNCVTDTLYLNFTGTDYYSGKIIVQLPTGFLADWSGTANTLPAPAQRTANLQLSYSRTLASNRIEVNCLWGPHPNRSVNDGLYFATLPVHNTSDTHGEDLVVSHVSYDFVDASGHHTSGFTVGTVTVTVDCDAPNCTVSYDALSCYGFRTSSQLERTINLEVLRETIADNAPLKEAYVEINGNAGQRITLFNTLQAGDYTNSSFPGAGDASTIFGWLDEGCNNLVLHGFDNECNHGTSTALNVIKDTTPITLDVEYTPPSFCFNDSASSSSYGGSELDNYLDISTDLSGGTASDCYAASGTISFESQSNPGSPYSLNIPPDLSLFPTAGDVLAFWNWIVSRVPSANGDEIFRATTTDCAGNADFLDFTICVDISRPGNTFTEFDARPTYLGVWLKWNWTYDTTPDKAIAMEIWRVGEGDYPTFASNLWMTDGNYEKLRGSLLSGGWALVAAQSGPDNTAAEYAGTHGGSGDEYWLDRDAAWDTLGVDHEYRDIYRYVTFVRDNGGNWSQVTNYTVGTNADRSTNYWLGDYSMDVVDDPDGSTGNVNSADLTLLSTHYFESVAPSFNYLDIGPENFENGFGKGIPDPDGAIDFADLVPFSFNFGMVSPGGFIVRPPSGRSFEELDAAPIVTVMRTDANELAVGSHLTVTVNLIGNAGSVKAIHAELKFDPEALEVAEISQGAVEVIDGRAWLKAKVIRDGMAGVAAAAMGESAFISGDAMLATVEFVVKSMDEPTRIELNSVRLADGQGGTTTGSGNVLSLDFGEAIPTSYTLYQNYPNPFNPTTALAFDLPESGFVTLRVYNVLGQDVATVISGNMPAGHHVVRFDASHLSSGVYIYVIEANGFAAHQKMLLMR